MHTHSCHRLLLIASVTLLLGAGALASTRAASFGYGGRLSLIGADHIGLGIGGGGHLDFGMDWIEPGMFHIRPNLTIWYGEDEAYWDERHYYDPYLPPWDIPQDGYYDVSIIQFAVHTDFCFYFPVSSAISVKPYVGLGLAPVSTFVNWEPGGDDNDIDFVGSLLGGIEFPMGPVRGMGEIRFQIGEIDLFKLTFGITATP
jgi:hypothetical protein